MCQAQITPVIPNGTERSSRYAVKRGAVLIDTRNIKEFTAGSIPGARNVPLGDVKKADKEKSKSGKKMILESQIDGKVDSINEENIKIGDIGKAIGRLAPSGKVKVNGEVVEAQSTGAFIDQQTEIRVIKVNSNKIIVEPVNKK